MKEKGVESFGLQEFGWRISVVKEELINEQGHFYSDPDVGST